ncbi:hypothetical protein ACSW8W_15150, partial (plasmid) [Clostridium perfringens]
MIDSLIIKSEIYRKKENELKEKDDKIEYLSKSIEELKKVINLKNDEIKSLKSKLNIVEDKLNRFNEFLNLVKIVDEIKIFKNNFLNFSK